MVLGTPFSSQGIFPILTFTHVETMAHILNATIGFLGLYENIQEDVYQNILSVAPHATPLASLLLQLPALFSYIP